MTLKVFSKHRWVLIIIDVLLILLLGILFNNISNHVLHDQTILFLVGACLLCWLLNYAPQKICFDYFTYAFKIFSGTFVLGLIYIHGFKHTQLAYELSLFLASCLIFAVLIRFLLRKLTKTTLHFLFLTAPATHHLQDDRIQVTQYDQAFHYDQLDYYDGLIIDRGDEYNEEQRKLIIHSELTGIPVLSTNKLEESLWGRVSKTMLDQAWIYNGFNLRCLYLVLKRLLDIFLVIFIAPIVISLSLIVTITIFCTMGSPILFTQERVGRDGKIFKIYKFRTMINNKANTETVANDARITKLGYFLRKTRLDELPQFINVLLGDMSIIGPRPEWALTAKKFSQEIPAYHLRQLVRPGITGWAQVTQGYATGVASNHEKQQYDVYYVKNISFWLDLKILVKTVFTVLTGKGAR